MGHPVEEGAGKRIPLEGVLIAHGQRNLVLGRRLPRHASAGVPPPIPLHRHTQNLEADIRVIDLASRIVPREARVEVVRKACLLYTSDAADERSSVDLGG